MLTQHTRKGLQLALGIGFGLGLIAGAALWMTLERPAPTDQETIARARRLGMTMATELPGAKVVVVIKPDTALPDLAAMLKEARVAQDSETFLARVQAKQPSGKPKPGVHVITAGQSLDELVDALVGTP
jgi:hypothetical protein